MSDRFLSLSEVQQIAGGASRTTIWRWGRQGIFPKPVKLGPQRVGWPKSAVDAWVENRLKAAGEQGE
jgi:prophage regulatory protein